MKNVKIFIFTMIMLCAFLLNVYAEPENTTYRVKVEGENLTASEGAITGNIDNSDLQIYVIKMFTKM